MQRTAQSTNCSEHFSLPNPVVEMHVFDVTLSVINQTDCRADTAAKGVKGNLVGPMV